MIYLANFSLRHTFLNVCKQVKYSNSYSVGTSKFCLLTNLEINVFKIPDVTLPRAHYGGSFVVPVTKPDAQQVEQLMGFRWRLFSEPRPWAMRHSLCFGPGWVGAVQPFGADAVLARRDKLKVMGVWLNAK